jgi:hypothetical protein
MSSFAVRSLSSSPREYSVCRQGRLHTVATSVDGFKDPIAPDEVAFEADVNLLLKAREEALRTRAVPGLEPQSGDEPETPVQLKPEPEPGTTEPEPSAKITFSFHGDVPPEIWNRLGTKLLPKLRSGNDLKVRFNCELTVDASSAKTLSSELHQILSYLGIAESVRVEAD